MTVPEQRGQFTARQVAQLLRPINPRRVLEDQRGNAHVSQQDVTAHLIRVFGFGNFDIEVLDVSCLFEQPRIAAGEVVTHTTRFDVAYRALVRITIRNEYGDMVCQYTNGSTHTAYNQKRGEAHDGAYKSAISLSIKRATIALGDQFGLSLYNKGQLAPLVGGTLVGAPDADTDVSTEGDDIQADVPQQVSLGNDEVEPDAPVDDDTVQGHLNRATGNGTQEAQ